MKRFVLLIVFSFFIVGAFAAPFKFLPHKITQPNGTVIECFLSGDEFFNWIHDKDGYSIIKASDGYYYYAVKEKEKIVASAYRVNTINPEKTGLKKWIRISKNEYDKKRAFYIDPAKSKISKAPHTGEFNNIVIYIRFNGDDELYTTRKSYDDKLNTETGNSLKAYFSEVSYNQLTISSSHYPDCASPSTTNASYEDSHARSYFQPYDASANPDGYDGDAEARDREHQLLADAIVWVNANYPVESSLDIDGDDDGYVDNVCFMIQGNSNGWGDLLWAHRWSLHTKTAYINGKQVYDYTFQPENQVEVVVLCHEMFHALGAPDLYHYDDDDANLSPVSSWDLMESGGGHMGAYMKYKYADKKWIPEIPEITSAGTYSLNPLTSSTNNCYKIASPNSNSEFFVFEYRKKSGEFESNLPGDGLLVYRINNNFEGNADYNGSSIFDEVYIYRLNGTTTNNGNVGSAYFSADVSRTSINDLTNPGSFLTDGSFGGLNILNITSSESTISFDVKFGSVDDPINFNAVSVSSSQINLNWDLNVDNNNVVVTYSLDGAFGNPQDGVDYSSGELITGGGEVLYSGNNTRYKHLSLASGQEYYYRIWSVNSNKEYSLGLNKSAYVPCEAKLLPLSVDFSAGTMPTCWQNVDNNKKGQIWQFDNPENRLFYSSSGANGFAILDSDNYGEGGSQDADLISPLMDLSIYSNVNLTFEHYFRFYEAEYAELLYSIDGGQSWSLIQKWISDEGDVSSPAIFNKDVSNLIAGESQVKVKWNYVGAWGYYWMLDDIEITGVSSGIPAVLTNDADGIRLDEAILNATVNANSKLLSDIKFNYGTTSGNYTANMNSIPNVATGSLNTHVAAQINGLSENTEYFYQVTCMMGAEVIAGEEKTFVTETRPECTISCNEVNWTNFNPLQIMLSFTEEITSLSEADFTITNASVTEINKTNTKQYTIDINAESDGVFTVQLAENSVEDLAGLGNVASNIFSINYDTSLPELVISSSESVSTTLKEIPLRFSFNEDVTGFEVSDIIVTNGTVDNFAASSASIYTADISPSDRGGISVLVNTEAVIDRAGNANVQSNEWIIGFSFPDGINDLMAEGIKVYPVPSNGMITVEFNLTINNSKINIFDLTGRLVYTNIIWDALQQQIDLTDQPKGTYIIQFTLDKKQISTPLIIQ